ncbi:class I SAM-dependent methyltransferase [Bacillus timonensis]|nr:class I SAM-dependent methyltransferase [Bacillus timonensis]
MIVTTAGRTNEEMIELAKDVAKDLHIKYVERKKSSIGEIHRNYIDDILVVGKERYEIHSRDNNAPFFYHPNSAMFRMKRIIKGEKDPFLSCVNIQRGKSFLDCTVGLGSDSILASYIVGENGKVIGLEANKFISYIVKKGLETWTTNLEVMNKSMRRIKIEHSTYEEFLIQSPDKSYDVIYFDPMFEEDIEESNGINPLKAQAHYSRWSDEIIWHAKRVARERIVLKDHWKSDKFQKFGFEVRKRKSAKFHYGVIELE